MLPPPFTAIAYAGDYGQVATDDGFDLRSRVAVVQARLNETLPRRHEARLRREHVEERSGAERVALLVHAERFFVGAHVVLLHAHLLFGVVQQTDLRDDRLLRGEPVVLQRALRAFVSVDLRASECCSRAETD